MVAAFFCTLGRRVTVRQEDGTLETVQAVPRAGWFKRIYVSATEYDMRVLRATLSCAPDECFPEGRSYQKVKELLRSESCNTQLYMNVHAAVASMFARMAVRERSANGRARTEPLTTPHVETFASNGLSIPRSHVAELGSLSMTHVMSQKLAALEAERVDTSSRWAMVVGEDGGSFGGAYLWPGAIEVRFWGPSAR